MKDIDIAAANDKQPVIYFIRCGEFVKIGKTLRGQVHFRFSTLNIGNPVKMELAGFIAVSPEQGEKEIHARFKPYRHRGEWFSASEEILQFIRQNCERPEARKKGRKPTKVKLQRTPRVIDPNKTKRKVTWNVSPEDHQRLKIYAAKGRATFQEMLNTAMNRWLVSKGRNHSRHYLTV